MLLLPCNRMPKNANFTNISFTFKYNFASFGIRSLSARNKITVNIRCHHCHDCIIQLRPNAIMTSSYFSSFNRMTSKRTRLCIATVLVCLNCCEALFYTSSKQNDYPRIGKRPRYPDVLDKFGFSKIQSDIFTHKLGGSEEFVHSLRESVIPAERGDSFDLIDGTFSLTHAIFSILL